jgi:hypothetical protein
MTTDSLHVTLVETHESVRKDRRSRRLPGLEANIRYSITSSASAKKFAGSSMPVAFAVLRLTTSL